MVPFPKPPERYLPFKKDRFGRFSAGESLAFRHNFLHRPLLNEWALKLSMLLKKKFPQLNILKPEYRFHPTYDVDMAWAYLNKSLFRNIAGTIRLLLQGKTKELKHRIAVQRGKAADAFFTFPYLDGLNKKWMLETGVTSLFICVNPESSIQYPAS